MELKPCPFCGGRVNFTYSSMSKTFNFYHKDAQKSLSCPMVEPIRLDGHVCESLAGAAEFWNRRAESEN